MRLLLIRHGQTAWNVERRMLGRTDLPLDTVGLAQAESLAARVRDDPALHVDAVYTSPMLRARQTAAPLAATLGLGLTSAPGLEELDVGELEGLQGPELDARFPGVMRAWLERPLDFRPPGGETLPDVAERAWAGLLRVRATGIPRVAVVSHQIVLGLLLARISGRGPGDFRAFFHKNTAFTVLDWQESPRVERLADAAHLT